MNLHSIVSGAISAVNPFISATRRRSIGYSTSADGSRVPIYTNIPVSLQVQALTFGDISQLDSLNIQGTRRAIYTSGAVFALLRVGQQGGDLLVFAPGTLPEGTVWLCAHVLEQWNDGAGVPAWVKLAITLQDGS